MDCTVSTNVLPERRRGFALPQPRLRRSRRVSRDARTGRPTSPRFCSLSNRARGGPRRAIEREARARIRSAVVGVQTNRLLPTSTHLVGIVAQKRSETATLGEAGHRCRNRVGAQEPSALVERCGHMDLGMRIYPERDLLRCLSQFVHREFLPPAITCSLTSRAAGQTCDGTEGQALIRSRSPQLVVLETPARGSRQIVYKARGTGGF